MINVYSADRFLRAVTGRAVSAVGATDIRVKLHTAQTPVIGNELSGGNYTDHNLALNTLTSDEVSGTTNIFFPGMEFVDDATSSTQSVVSIALWHGISLSWHASIQIIPVLTERIFSPSTGIRISVNDSSSLTLTNSGSLRGLMAVAGQGYVDTDVFWEFHNTNAGTDVPSVSNRLTGGGIDGIADTSWTEMTVGNVRQTIQGELLFSSALSGFTSEEPDTLALWLGRPESSGTLLAYRRATPSGSTEGGSKVFIPADETYIGIGPV